MSERKLEPGQRAYEAMCANSPRGENYPWADISQRAKEAWAAVEQACAVPAEAGQSEAWVSVEERLPDVRAAVLAWDGRLFAISEWDGSWSDIVPTHWRPLPPPPKSSEGGE